jgi:hypothetical protein
MVMVTEVMAAFVKKSGGILPDGNLKGMMPMINDIDSIVVDGTLLERIDTSARKTCVMMIVWKILDMTTGMTDGPKRAPDMVEYEVSDRAMRRVMERGILMIITIDTRMSVMRNSDIDLKGTTGMMGTKGETDMMKNFGDIDPVGDEMMMKIYTMAVISAATPMMTVLAK